MQSRWCVELWILLYLHILVEALTVLTQSHVLVAMPRLQELLESRSIPPVQIYWQFDPSRGRTFMATYAEIQAQIAELQAQAEKVRKDELASAIAQVKALMAQYGITINDLQGVTKNARKISPVKAKYRDPVSGNEWTGRGRSPKWLEGKNKDDFAI